MEVGSGREVSAAPPLARVDWPADNIARYDWTSRLSVGLGAGRLASIHSYV